MLFIFKTRVVFLFIACSLSRLCRSIAFDLFVRKIDILFIIWFMRRVHASRRISRVCPLFHLYRRRIQSTLKEEEKTLHWELDVRDNVNGEEIVIIVNTYYRVQYFVVFYEYEHWTE